jgi:hypothetical protein
MNSKVGDEYCPCMGADRITLVVLWDQKPGGDAPGGTAHMVSLAKDAGNVHIISIDSNQLLI